MKMTMRVAKLADFQWEPVGTIGWTKVAFIGNALFDRKVEAIVTVIGGEPMATVKGEGETKINLRCTTVKQAKAWATAEFNRRVGRFL